MAKIYDIIFCLNATNFPGQGACANTILSAITPEYIPGLFTFSVVMTITDLLAEHSIEIDFASENDQVVHLEGSIPSIPDNSNLPNEHKGINLTLDWNNINFKEAGLYTLTVKVDGEFIGSKSIFVKGKNQQ